MQGRTFFVLFAENMELIKYIRKGDFQELIQINEK